MSYGKSTQDGYGKRNIDPTTAWLVATALVSTTPSEHFHTWRYSHWMDVDCELRAYAEAARPNESNEIRLFRLQN